MAWTLAWNDPLNSHIPLTCISPIAGHLLPILGGKKVSGGLCPLSASLARLCTLSPGTVFWSKHPGSCDSYNLGRSGQVNLPRCFWRSGNSYSLKIWKIKNILWCTYPCSPVLTSADPRWSVMNLDNLANRKWNRKGGFMVDICREGARVIRKSTRENGRRTWQMRDRKRASMNLRENNKNF